MSEIAYDPPNGEPYSVREMVEHSLGKVTVETECENAGLVDDKLIVSNEENIVT